MKAITFNKENEAIKQGGIPPSDILYCGSIDSIQDSDLVNWGIGYNDLAMLLKEANGDESEDFVLIIKSNDGL